MNAIKWLRFVLGFVALFHVVAGVGLMFSTSFQEFAVTTYGATLPWDVRDVYYIRIIGSFAFGLGYLSAVAARHPLEHKVVIVGLVGFFILRSVSRHLYSQELYSGFGVSPLVNNLTSVFFGVQAVILAVLLWRVRESE